MAQQLQADGEQVALLALFDTMNWSKIPTTLWNKLTYGSQRLVFHASSFVSLNLGDQSKFLREKMETLRSRIPVWRGMLLAKFSRNPSSTASLIVVTRPDLANERSGLFPICPKTLPRCRDGLSPLGAI